MLRTARFRQRQCCNEVMTITSAFVWGPITAPAFGILKTVHGGCSCVGCTSHCSELTNPCFGVVVIIGVSVKDDFALLIVGSGTTVVAAHHPRTPALNRSRHNRCLRRPCYVEPPPGVSNVILEPFTSFQFHLFANLWHTLLCNNSVLVASRCVFPQSLNP